MNSITQAVIESFINGKIDQASHTSKVHCRLADSFLPLPKSPVTSVTSITHAGQVVIAEYELSYFGLKRVDGLSWPAGVFEITFTTGWTSYPIAIRRAATLIRSWLATSPESGVTQIMLGDQTVKRTAPGVQPPALIQQLLAEFRKPEGV